MKTLTARRAYERNDFNIVKHVDVKEHLSFPIRVEFIYWLAMWNNGHTLRI